ncbi:SMP-30/gluconolactonase/LRE family protein [Spirillospora sp. NPDC050679]
MSTTETRPRVRAAGDVRALVGECPVPDGGRLLWVDVHGGNLHRTDPDSGETETTEVGPPLPFAWPYDGGLLWARGLELRHDDRVVASLTGLPPGVERFNDGVVDRDGRIWIGTMGAPGTAALYRIDPGGEPVPVVTGVTISNGVRFSPDGSRLYYADTPTGRIDVFDVEGGTLTGRRTFAEVGGPPDGLAVDGDGRVWVAVWGGGRVQAHAPDGRLVRSVPLPVAYPTACAFAEGRLFVTSASRPLGDQAGPLDGALLEVIL